MAFTRIVLLRHGETNWNVEGRHLGQLDSPLSATGVAQAEALAVRLRQLKFIALYCSDLGRAQRTAAVIAAGTGHSVQVEPRLRERHLGVFQGLLEAEIQSRYPREYCRWREGDPDYVIPEGESARQHYARVTECLEEVGRRHAGERVVVVTHAGALDAALRKTLGLALDAPRRFKRRNGSWNVFSIRKDGWFLETWGDLSHCPPGAM